MRIIKALTLRSYWTKHRDTESWLKTWLQVARAAKWQNLKDVQKTYKKAESAKVQSGNVVTIFDVRGDRYRLIVAIHYNTKRVYVRDFMTHEEYNNQLWKRRH